MATERCRCYEEVARLHGFFQEWFHGTLRPDEFAVCEAALVPGFAIVTPAGQLLERDEILHVVRAHHGGESPDFRIETMGRRCDRVGDIHVTTYEERHLGPRPTVRLSTAVLSEAGDRFGWHRVHETWITV
jgi:hypothetical protein